MRAAAEERRTPGMMRNLVEPLGGFDPHEGIRRSQLSWRDGGEGRGTMVPLQGVEFFRRSRSVCERRGDLGRNAPTDRRGLRAERGFGGNRVPESPLSSSLRAICRRWLDFRPSGFGTAHFRLARWAVNSNRVLCSFACLARPALAASRNQPPAALRA